MRAYPSDFKCECGYTMFIPDRWDKPPAEQTLECLTKSCPHFRVKYRLPTVELEPVTNTIEDSDAQPR